MTIKAKLIANVLVTSAIVIAISLFSFFSMRFLQEKLAYLTEKSSPFQIRTIELQRELQGCLTTLVKVNAARNMTEYSNFHAEAEKTLWKIEGAEKILEKMGNSAPGVSDDIGRIALDLFIAAEDRINSNNAATAANASVLQSMKESTARLNDLDEYIRNLQINYSKAYTAAMENTGKFSGRLRSIEDLRNLVRELQLIALNVGNLQNRSHVLIAKGKLKYVTGRIAGNEYYRSNPSIASLTNGFTDMLAEYVELQSVAVAQKDDESKSKAAAFGNNIPEKQNSLFQTLDQETMSARDELAIANNRQGSLFAQSNSANSILVANSELVALGLMVTGDTSRLFTLDSLAELGKLDSEIRSLFTKINERVQMLEISLNKLNANKELLVLNEAAASLAAIRNKIYLADGIITTLKKKLNAIEQANKSTDELHALVIKQSAQGNESISAVKGEQEKAVLAVYQMIRRSLSRTVGVGIVAIVIGSLFGFWIYRSVLLPLRVVLGAVSRQREQGKEKALLAEAVAKGDLTREVIVSEAIQLDPAQITKDEMGMVLNSVVGMSEAQVTLDRAFAGMTASLRSSRDDEVRRDRLKSGLHELNKILRVEHAIAEQGNEALAFLADFLNAGVGILYLYDEKSGLLQTLSTYAVSRSRRLDDGFRLGEGLVGQVALDRKMICLDSLPPDYLPIASALGEAEPLNVVILPIMHNDNLAGVLELGSFRTFGDDDFAFLNQSLEGIAIALNANRSRQEVKDLLVQTQQQAEELRVQQEELQQTNEELEERARVLVEQRNYNRY